MNGAVFPFGYLVISGDNPYDGLYGEAPPERGTSFRIPVYERVGIWPDEFYGFRKSRKRYIVVTDSYFMHLHSVHLQQ